MDFSNSLPYLLALRFKTFLKSSFDFIQSSYCFYSNDEFRNADLKLLSAYYGVNPYRLSLKFLKERGASTVYAYGETPLMTLDRIVQECGLTASDTIFELGCGRGRACFWLSCILKAKVVGIDYVPEFIEKAEKVKNQEKLKGLKFLCEDFLKSKLKGATVIYLHGSCMEDRDIECLNEKLIKLPKGLKVITVSFNMSDYDDGKYWKQQKVFTESFSWGQAEVFLQTLM